jgi:Cu(I)/Ag(I) efflux system periplasmic protein CusF
MRDQTGLMCRLIKYDDNVETRKEVKMKYLLAGALALTGISFVQTTAMAEADHSAGHGHTKMLMQEERFEAIGTINSIDTENRKINVSHDPIAALGWPSMTMDFSVSEGLDLAGITLGKKVGFMLAKGEGGLYLIDEVMKSDGHHHSQ